MHAAAELNTADAVKLLILFNVDMRAVDTLVAANQLHSLQLL